jgi:hypothetical protein
MRRRSRRRRAGSSAGRRLSVTTVSAVLAAAVAVIAIVVAVATRIIVHRRWVPPCPVRIIADHVWVIGTVTGGVAVILALRHIILNAPRVLRLILPRRAPLSDHRERDHRQNREARAETCPRTSVPRHIEHLTKNVVPHPQQCNALQLADRPAAADSCAEDSFFLWAVFGGLQLGGDFARSRSSFDDCLVERSEFELPVPVSKLPDDTIMLSFATSRRAVKRSHPGPHFCDAL